MIDGAKIIIGGKEYTLPDLNLKTVQKVYAYFPVLGDPSNSEFITAIIKVITAGLQRNYPDITEDEIAENALFHEIQELSVAITNQFTKKKQMGMLAPQTNQSTGENSTPESLPPQAGPGNT
jgi:hypothetical protein